MTQIRNLKPNESWEFMQQNANAILLDIRTKLEYSFVGHPIGAVHIVWKDAPDWSVNPNFAAEVRQAVPDTKMPVLLLCRSGRRSMDAAVALQKAGYSNLVNVDEGFEGPLDDEKHRGTLGGWRFHGLPWEQS